MNYYLYSQKKCDLNFISLLGSLKKEQAINRINEVSDILLKVGYSKSEIRVFIKKCLEGA